MNKQIRTGKVVELIGGNWGKIVDPSIFYFFLLLCIWFTSFNKLWNIYVAIYKYVQITRKNWNLKDISYVFPNRKLIGLKIGYLWFFPENEYYRLCRFKRCYQRFILYYSWEVLKYVDRSDWLPAPPQQKLTGKTGNQNDKYDRDYKPLIVSCDS